MENILNIKKLSLKENIDEEKKNDISGVLSDRISFFKKVYENCAAFTPIAVDVVYGRKDACSVVFTNITPFKNIKFNARVDIGRTECNVKPINQSTLDINMKIGLTDCITISDTMPALLYDAISNAINNVACGTYMPGMNVNEIVSDGKGTNAALYSFYSAIYTLRNETLRENLKEFKNEFTSIFKEDASILGNIKSIEEKISDNEVFNLYYLIYKNMNGGKDLTEKDILSIKKKMKSWGLPAEDKDVVSVTNELRRKSIEALGYIFDIVASMYVSLLNK